MRRTTLGGVGGGTANSRASLGPRASMGPARMSLGPNPGKRAGGGSRKSSMGPGARQSMGRRSSAYGGGGSTNRPKADPRPIKEKEFMNQTIKKLIIYLSQNGYDCTISPKILKAPTSKDFANMFDFLAHQFDPNHKTNPNIVEEVSATMNRLRYPFLISKSALQAIGSPHTWPHLLAVLGWMVELLEYDYAANGEEDELHEEDAEKFFFSYLSRSYEGFLAGEDDEAQQDAELQERFDLRNASVQNDVNTLTEENAAMQAEVEQLQSRQAERAAMEERRDAMSGDIGKFEQLIEQLQTHKEMMGKKIDDKKAEVAEREAELEESLREREELELIVSQQDMSVGDVQRLQHDVQQMDDNLRRATEAKARVDKELWDTEVTVANMMDSVEEAVREHGKRCEALKLLPASAKNANGVDFSLKFDREGKSDTTFLDKDVKRALKPQLSEAQSRLVAKFHGLQDELYASEENKDQTAFKITDKREAITSLEERTARAESTLGTEKELWGEKNRAATEEVDTLDARIHRLKTADESSLADSQRALEDLHTQYTETSQRFVAEKVLMNDSLLTMTSELADHREYNKASLDALSQKADGILKQVSLFEDE